MFDMELDFKNIILLFIESHIVIILCCHLPLISIEDWVSFGTCPMVLKFANAKMPSMDELIALAYNLHT